MKPLVAAAASPVSSLQSLQIRASRHGSAPPSPSPPLSQSQSTIHVNASLNQGFSLAAHPPVAKRGSPGFSSSERLRSLRHLLVDPDLSCPPSSQSPERADRGWLQTPASHMSTSLCSSASTFSTLHSVSFFSFLRPTRLTRFYWRLFARPPLPRGSSCSHDAPSSLNSHPPTQTKLGNL